MTAPYPFVDWQEPLEELCTQGIGYSIHNRMGNGGEIGSFKYSSAGAHVLSAIITNATGKSAREFANEYLFQPLGMSEIQTTIRKHLGSMTYSEKM